MRKTLFSGLLICAGFLTGSPLSAQSSIDQFSWMKGDWKGSTGPYEFYESWVQQDANTLTGKSYSINKSDTSIFELMRIEQVGDHWVFIAIIEKSNPVLFTLIETKNNIYVFENKEHDYPQRVVYSLKEDGKMLAWIEGEKNGQKTKDEYLLEKIK